MPGSEKWGISDRDAPFPRRPGARDLDASAEDVDMTFRMAELRMRQRPSSSHGALGSSQGPDDSRREQTHALEKVCTFRYFIASVSRYPLWKVCGVLL